jgi:hypothetical protein
MLENETDVIPVSDAQATDEGTSAGMNLLVAGVLLFVLGLVIITLSTFRFDLVKNQVFVAHPDWAPYVAGFGYASALTGLVLSLVHFIREG